MFDSALSRELTRKTVKKLIFTKNEKEKQKAKRSVKAEQYHFHVIQKGSFVFMPDCKQFFLQRKLFTSYLHGDFKAICVKVIKVCHTYRFKKKEDSL